MIRFCKLDEKEFIAGGIVYRASKLKPGADRPDSQGDVMTAETIWRAMTGWMKRGAVVKVMHKGQPLPIEIIENFQAETETRKGRGIIRKGDWYAALYFGETPETREIFLKILDGTYTGFSIGGESASASVGKSKADDFLHLEGPE